MVPLLAAIETQAAGSGLLIACALFAVGFAALVWRKRTLAGTTLVAPWWWSLAVLVSLTAVEAIAAVTSTATWVAPLRYLAAMSTFTPIMALLGAKRPQDRGWQFIVLSLWGILSLPAFEWLLFGGVAEIHPARFWFLIILIGVGATNHVGTRWWPASLFYSAGQVVLLLPYFSATPPLAPHLAAWLGTACIVASWALMALDWPRARAARTSLDRVWIDFRDAFGAVWALRVAERINSSAAMYDWPVALGWQGFVRRLTSGEAGHETAREVVDVPPAVEESLRTILRRFVSAEWIDLRLQRTAPQEAVAETTASTR